MLLDLLISTRMEVYKSGLRMIHCVLKDSYVVDLFIFTSSMMQLDIRVKITASPLGVIRTNGSEFISDHACIHASTLGE